VKYVRGAWQVIQAFPSYDSIVPTLSATDSQDFILWESDGDLAAISVLHFVLLPGSESDPQQPQMERSKKYRNTNNDRHYMCSISEGKKPGKSAPGGFLSPVRLPFRHTGNPIL
jgi:hypothetical protein